jgi:pyruvate formate lyase activating enzyme
VKARFARTSEDDGRVVCELCPRGCRLRDGESGVCFVRSCRAGALVLDTYGRSTGLCVDPIEKKPLYHFLPGTRVLSFGTAGCNLLCKFCQNWQTSRARDWQRASVEALPEAIAQAAVDEGCPSVAMTYNDPVVFFEYAVDVAEACHRLGVRTVAVTAGYIATQARAEFFRHFDAANIDLKGFSERFYRTLCGADLKTVLDTLVHVRTSTKTWLEITTLLIPGENDEEAELDAMTRWLVANLGADVPLHFSAFHPDFRLLDRPATPPETLRRAREIARANGLRYVYIGNITDRDGSTTFCPCGEPLITRSGFQLTSFALTATNTCPACAAPCPGRFT